MEQTLSVKSTDRQWKSIYTLGGITTILALCGILLDVIIGNITGGNLTTLPQTSVGRFTELHNNYWLGLYNLDFLNLIIQIFMIPTYFALFAAHRNGNPAYAALTIILFLTGTIILVTGNSALSMSELGNKYFSADTESQKNMYAAAGEAFLARGAHGSHGAFLGFFIPTTAGLIMSVVMLRGKIFSKTAAVAGIAGNILMLLYIPIVTFVQHAKTMATVLAMPGGLLLMAWMIMITIKLFQLSNSERAE